MDATLLAGVSRRFVLSGLASGSLLACTPSASPWSGSPPAAQEPPATSSPGAWEGWQRFANRFITDAGRVVDLTFGGKSTSEGQAYGLFFALVAGDRARFAAILQWTDANLADGNLGARLPGWLWGLRDDGSWGMKDRGPASDADLWIAYSLLQAARLWKETRYDAIARGLLAAIAEREVLETGTGRAWLLPGPYGFDLGGGRYRFDPSYLPGFLFRALAATDPTGPWALAWSTYREAMPLMFPAGIAPDLCVVTRDGQVQTDPERGAVGSYDAIRVYLWAGLSQEVDSGPMACLNGMPPLIARYGAPPEKIDTQSGEAMSSRYLPPGFAGAVLPFLVAHGDADLLDGVRTRVSEHEATARAGKATNYYDEALILFGAGWLEGRYRLSKEGRLEVPWSAA